MNTFYTMLMICLMAVANISFAQETAKRVTRTGSFELPCSADTAFPLFGPEGEKAWSKEWDPQPLFPDKLEFSSDTVFLVNHGGENSVWTVLDADWKTHRVEYIRLAPHTHTGRIVVKVEPLGPERSKVVVTYTITAFGEHAANLVEAFSEEAYAARMSGWQQGISAYLAEHKSKGTNPAAAPPTSRVR